MATATRNADAPLLTPTDVTIGIVAEPPVARTYPKWFTDFIAAEAALGRAYARRILRSRTWEVPPTST